MTPETQHLAEKIQVRVAAVLAGLISWWAIWCLVRPMDSQAAWVFFVDGAYSRLAVFAAMVWALAAGCAALTLSARAEGAIAATLVGVAAMGVRSGPARNLLGPREGEIGTVFARLACELLVMAAVLAVAVIIIHVIRALARPLLPGWSWRGPPGEGEPVKGKPAGKAGAGGSVAGGSALVPLAGFVAMQLAVAMVLLVVTFQSAETGQIAFALAGSFFVASFVAHLAFPIRSSIPCWVGPVIMGVLVLALGAIGDFGGPGPMWRRAIMVASRLPLRAALPVHWIGLGCGGAVAGFWASCRFREAPEEKPKLQE
ncbi:MAG: hypothetical protein ACYS5V_14105 [Planctomycetota bacterium]